jgi:hemoglobin
MDAKVILNTKFPYRTGRYRVVLGAIAVPPLRDPFALSRHIRRRETTDASLYERLGRAFAIAAVVDHLSDAVVRNPIVGQTSENPACGNGTRTIWADFHA